MITEISQIVTIEEAEIFLQHFSRRVKRSTITPKQLSNQIRIKTPDECKDFLSKIIPVGCGNYVSAKGKTITTPTIRTKFKWAVIPSLILTDLEQSIRGALGQASEGDQSPITSVVDDKQALDADEYARFRKWALYLATAIKPLQINKAAYLSGLI